jgi:hypothetical protein
MSRNKWLALALGLSLVANFALLVRAADDARKPRLFELRTYVAADGKLDALQARFRDHTVKLFEKHGMTNVGYFTPAEGPGAKSTLVYLLAFPDKEARDKAFKEFGADPEWVKARQESEANGKLVEKVESLLLNPTDYSTMK